MPVQTMLRGCAVLTVALATAALAACTATSPSPPATSAGHMLVPGISGPPAITPNAIAGSAGRTVRPHITLPPIPPASSGDPVGLPLDAYIQASVQQDQTLSAAAAQVAQRCMSAAGFSSPVQPEADDETLIDQFAEHRDAGLTSLAQARSFGFQLPPASFKTLNKIQTPLPTFASEQRKHGTAWASALLGAVPGKRPGTPPLGCLRAANTLVFGNFNGNLELGLAGELLYTGYSFAGSDPHVLAAQRAWSACMARRGLHYKSSDDLEWNRTWPNPPTPAETAAAVADVRCNQQANLAHTYLTVEAAYQQAALGLNESTIHRVQADFGTMQQRAEQVLQLPPAVLLRFSRLQVHRAVPYLIPRR